MLELILIVVAVAFTARWMYKAGKAEGSRKGFHVGLRRNRRR